MAEKPTKKAVRIECKGAGTLGLALLKPLQGDLKTLAKEDYERLKAEIIADGFSFPVAVWENKEDAQIYILDGHQRTETLRRMKAEGFSIPEIPVVFVEADSPNQAKHKLLAAASQYGVVQEDGLLSFLKGMDASAEDLLGSFKFPEINLQDFAAKHLLANDLDEGDIGYPAGAGTVIGGGSGDPAGDPSAYGPPPDGVAIAGAQQVRMVQLFFNGETQPEFLQKCAKLQQVHGTANITDTVMEVVREAFDSLGES